MANQIGSLELRISDRRTSSDCCDAARNVERPPGFHRAALHVKWIVRSLAWKASGTGIEPLAKAHLRALAHRARKPRDVETTNHGLGRFLRQGSIRMSVQFRHGRCSLMVETFKRADSICQTISRRELQERAALGVPSERMIFSQRHERDGWSERDVDVLSPT